MVFISNHIEKGKHYFAFFIIISGRYLLVTFYEFINLKLIINILLCDENLLKWNRTQ